MGEEGLERQDQSFGGGADRQLYLLGLNMLLS